MSSKFVRPEVTALVRRNTRAYHSLVAEEMGVSLLEYERRVRRHLRNLYRDADVCIRLTPAALESVVESGRYTNSAIRQELEHPYFEERPAYGYVSTGNERARSGRGVAAIEFYGRAKIVLRRSLRSRTTVTLGDSAVMSIDPTKLDSDNLDEGSPSYGKDFEFAGMFAGQERPAPIDDPDVYACLPSTEPLEWREVDPLPEPRFDSYTEAQIHGGVTAADIERVYAMGCDPDEQERIRRAADKLSVPFHSTPLSDDQPMIPNWDTLYRLTHSGYTPAHESLLHGDEHWRRVANNGLRLAAETPGADPRIVLLFALFHDAFRETDGHDPDHGLRAAAVVERLADELLPFDKTTLQYALAYHDNGDVCSEPTIGVCWDSDRLELPRVGITVDPAYLSTEAGRKLAGREPSRYSPYWPKLYLRGALRWHQNGRWSLATSLESARGIAAGRERETLKRLEVSEKAA